MELTSTRNNDDWTSLHFACYNGHVAVVIELLNPNDSSGAATSIFGKRKSREGADIAAKNSGGDTPLHCTSRNGHLSVVKVLLSSGADILAATNQGNIPIHVAGSFRNSAVATYLLRGLYATTRRLPLHQLLEDLPWMRNPNSSDVPPLRAALHHNVLGMDNVV
jgi:ankyrin repeat protein